LAECTDHTGFKLGSTVQAMTKGIWVWCIPHPRKAGTSLLLLDTEGLGDVEKVWQHTFCTASCDAIFCIRL